ncbi:putative integral membrane protein TIGR02587 [Rhizobium sp. RU20A]|uniref:TIGR02587 family membrane protein n=1 Tax=Rhizobium sp. RU20A TaxID=1907412 RepID=UPI000956CE5B|nr:TIGR02587 family membrane protein [Rhizobium sp. RU20A]SIQ89770.1 putative integral membrane protein TIGR02587 [Rhizobium sp. RU20A]
MAKADECGAKDGGSLDGEDRRFLTGLARGLAGALLFSLPMLMTMEMWFLGLYVHPLRLLVLCTVNLPMLVLLAHYIGFEKSIGWGAAYRDAITAYGLGILVSAGFLLLFNVLGQGATMATAVAQIALQAVPASIGALLGRSQLGDSDEEGDEEDEGEKAEAGYGRELFMMVVGALFLNLNVAPTEEMNLIAFKATPVHTLLMVVTSIVLMHGFVYAVQFRGGHRRAEGAGWWRPFFVYTIPGYVLALLVSLYALWTFERVDSVSLQQIMTTTVVLGLPAAIGAASARLIL